MPTSSVRLKLLGSLVGAAFVVILARLWWLQLTHWPEYSAEAIGNRTATVRKPAPRGLIRDREGRVLAENREVWSLRVLPSELPRDDVVLERSFVPFLANVLTTPENPISTADVRAALYEARKQRALEAVPLGELGEDLSFDQMAAIEERRLEMPGIRVVTTTRRHYPYGALASQVIGYARPITREQLDKVRGVEYPRDPMDPTAAHVSRYERDLVYATDSCIGEQGVEALCELDRSGDVPVPVLPGRSGRVVYEVNAVGDPQRLVAEREPVPGAEVRLTLDAHIQQVAERGLRDAIADRPGGMGAAVVMDVRNGEVLALASQPCLDPNDWANGLTAEQWQMATAQPGLPLLDKALGGAYPPGSVFKVVSVCAALETTKVRTGTTANCTGRIIVGRRREPFRCWAADRGGHGHVDLYEAIARSCNIFFYQCVLDWNLEPDNIAAYARRFGLGETTGLGLPGEVAGNVPSPSFSFTDTGQPWRLGNSLNFVIGQDRLMVTPLQMCVVCAAIANGGRLLTPNLVREIRWPAYLHRARSRNIVGKSRPLDVRPETLAIVRAGMRRAVTEPYGTAHALDSLGIPCAGKTGSAQHRPGENTHAWFICFAPYDDPRYALCVFIAGGGAGGEVALPVAARILRALFHLEGGNPEVFAPPTPVSPQIAAKLRAERIAAARAWAEERKRGEGEASNDEVGNAE